MKSKNLKFILLTIFFCFIFSNYLIAANRIDDDIRDVENFSINDSYLDESLAGFTIKESIFHTETDAEIASNSEQENTQKAFQLEDNPCISLSEKLTVQTTAIFYVFSIKEQDRILMARMLSENKDFDALLCQFDKESGKLTPTSVSCGSGNEIRVKSIPQGDYAFAVYSKSGKYGESFIFDINASNPSADFDSVIYSKATDGGHDVTKVIVEYTSGDVYSNGKFIYNQKTGIGNDLSWERKNEVNWGSGYEQRTHKVSEVKIKGRSRLVSYSSSYASSDLAILLYCDVGTNFLYFHSKYQSGPDHFYEQSFMDAYGRKTPRSLDEKDFEDGQSHVVVLDLHTGKLIDFYSQLNEYYGFGYEDTPVVHEYE